VILPPLVFPGCKLRTGDRVRLPNARTYGSSRTEYYPGVGLRPLKQQVISMVKLKLNLSPFVQS